MLTASGLVRYESRLDTEIRVLVLPRGWTPTNWSCRTAPLGPFGGRSATRGAVLDRVLAEEDLTTAKGKGNAVDRLLPVIATIDNPAERHHYPGAAGPTAARGGGGALLHTLDRLRGARDGRGRPAQRARALSRRPRGRKAGPGRWTWRGGSWRFSLPSPLLPEAWTRPG